MLDDILGDNEWIQGVVLVIAGILIAVLIGWVLTLILNFAANRTSSVFTSRIIRALRLPIFFTLLIIGVLVAIEVIDPDEDLQDVIITTIQVVGIIVWAIFFIRISRIILGIMSGESARYRLISSQTLPLFQNFATLVVAIVAIYLLFDTLGINMTAWLASAGVIGIVIGLAAQDTLSNFIAGIAILADSPYQVGDYIVLDTGERGKVTYVGIRSTRILTRDDVEMIIPNSVMGNSKIINESGGPYTKYRVRVPVGTAYGSDVDQVRKILMDVAKTNPLIETDPEPRVRFREFGASSLDFELLCWVPDPEYRGRAIDQLLDAIYRAFSEHNVAIPFPQQDVHIKEWPDDRIK